MKILQINTTLNKGSTGRIAEQIGETIIKNRGESFIVYSSLGLPSLSKSIKIGNSFDVYFHALQTRLFDNHGLASKSVTKKLVKKIELIKPDIIHLHNIHGYYINIEILFKFFKKANIPLVWTLHDCWSFTGHCSFFDGVNCEKWKDECSNCPLKKAYPASWYIDNSKSNFYKKKELFTEIKNLTIVTPSVWLKNLVKQSFLKEYPVKVINNGIDIEIFNLNHENLVKDKTIILGVANIWNKRKGFNDFLELKKILPNSFKIILIGLSKDQKKVLPDGIVGIERTESLEQLVKYYNMADIFINPTYSDNLPTTNIEALACGTPIITYNTGGSPEIIDGDTGIIVDKGNIAGIKKAIFTILQDKEKYKTNMCRERALKYFNKKNRFDDYYKLYINILKEVKD